MSTNKEVSRNVHIFFYQEINTVFTFVYNVFY